MRKWRDRQAAGRAEAAEREAPEGAAGTRREQRLWQVAVQAACAHACGTQRATERLRRAEGTSDQDFLHATHAALPPAAQPAGPPHHERCTRRKQWLARANWGQAGWEV